MKLLSEFVFKGKGTQTKGNPPANISMGTQGILTWTQSSKQFSIFQIVAICVYQRIMLHTFLMTTVFIFFLEFTHPLTSSNLIKIFEMFLSEDLQKINALFGNL